MADAKLSYGIKEAAPQRRRAEPLPREWRLAYSIANAADELGVCIRTVWRMVSQGDLRTFTMAGRTLIRADELHAYAERRAAPVTEPESPPTPAQPVSGVYLLYDQGALSYVGRSADLRSRLGQHRRSGRPFDEVRCIACDEERAGWLEAELIRVLQPPTNVLRYARRATLAVQAIGALEQ